MRKRGWGRFARQRNDCPTNPPLEVQARDDLVADPFRTQLTGSLRDARMVAAQWREAALSLGGFRQLGVLTIEGAAAQRKGRRG